MKAEFKTWLSENYAPSSADTHFWSVRKVEEVYGDLDAYFDEGQLETLAAQFSYSKKDERDGRANPTRISTGKSLYSNLGAFKAAIRCYKRFRDGESEATTEKAIEVASLEIREKKEGKQFEVERHLQENLRREIEQLEDGLSIIDGGAERSVESGFIDILAQDRSGELVVVELKAGIAKREAVGQIAGYMGDLMAEEPGTVVRGILVAGEFDKSCRSGVRAIAGLSLKRYRFSFAFEDIG